MKRLSFVALSAMLFAVSCFPVIKGEGDVITEQRTFDTPIEGLAVSSGIDVILDSSVPVGEARIITSQNIMEYVVIETQNNSLRVEMRRGNGYDVDRLEVRLSPEGLTSFAVSGGAELECLDELVVDGNIAIAVSGGADVELRGSCRELSVAVSGGADAHLGELCAEKVSAAASGGADLEVYATTSYDINASGGADVEYRLTSATVKTYASGGADIRATR